MASINEPERGVRRELREEVPPMERREPTARSVEAFETPTAVVPPGAARPLGRGHQRVYHCPGDDIVPDCVRASDRHHGRR